MDISRANEGYTSCGPMAGSINRRRLDLTGFILELRGMCVVLGYPHGVEYQGKQLPEQEGDDAEPHAAWEVTAVILTGSPERTSLAVTADGDSFSAACQNAALLAIGTLHQRYPDELQHSPYRYHPRHGGARYYATFRDASSEDDATIMHLAPARLSASPPKPRCPRAPRRFPSPPAALSPFQPYINPPRTSSVRFRLSPPFLLDGIELAPSLSLSAVAVELRSAVVVIPDHLPPRRRLLRLHRILADLVHPSVLLADHRNAVDPDYPSRAAAFLRSGRLFCRRRRPRVSRGPPLLFPLPFPSLGRCSAVPMAAAGDHRGAGAASRRLRRLGRPRARRVAAAWGPTVSHPRPRVRLTRGAHGAGRCEPGFARSTVDREAAAWAPLSWTRSARPSPRLTQ
uniref:Putative retrotransposon protein n=1 Tax=Oryza sativa subsp. japonica TaxID=39947 RepID=Q6UU43_ORYSJ|nr:putative retrotransposon protein [Oryza sativa Japonica Group]